MAMARWLAVALLTALGLAASTLPSLAGTAEGQAALERGDFALAYQELLGAAEAGDARAQLLVGFLLRAGAGVAADAKAAVGWFEKAAAQGSAEAKGEDHATAAQWMLRGAEAGDPSAQANLGLMHMQGHGVPQDESAARRWFERAAEQDESRAQMQLGVMNSNGLAGFEKNNVQALFWFTIVARKMEDELQGAATELGTGLLDQMSDDDIMEAQRLAREWRAKRQ
jgi:TPR repeat protein